MDASTPANSVPDVRNTPLGQACATEILGRLRPAGERVAVAAFNASL